MKACVLLHAALCILGAGVTLAAPAPAFENQIPESLLAPVDENAGVNFYQHESEYSYKPRSAAGKDLMQAITTALHKLDNLYAAIIPSDLVRIEDPEYAEFMKRRERDIQQFELISKDIVQVYNNQNYIAEHSEDFGEELSEDELADRKAMAGYLRAYFDLPIDKSIHGRTIYEHFLNKDMADVEYVQQIIAQYQNANQRERKNLIRKEHGLANPNAFLRAAKLNAKIAESEAWLRGSRSEAELKKIKTKTKDRHIAMKKLEKIVQWYKELRDVERDLVASMEALQFDGIDELSEDQEDEVDFNPDDLNGNARLFDRGQDDELAFGDDIGELYPEEHRVQTHSRHNQGEVIGDEIYPGSDVIDRRGEAYSYRSLSDIDDNKEDAADNDNINVREPANEASSIFSDEDDEEGNPSGLYEGVAGSKRGSGGFYYGRHGRPEPVQPQPANDNLFAPEDRNENVRLQEEGVLDRDTREPEPELQPQPQPSQPENNPRMRDSSAMLSSVTLGNTMDLADRMRLGGDSIKYPAGLITGRYPNKKNAAAYRGPENQPDPGTWFADLAAKIALDESQKIPQKKRAATTDDVPKKQKSELDLEIEELLRSSGPSPSLGDLEKSMSELDFQEERDTDLNELARLAGDIKVPEQIKPAEEDNDEFGDLESLYRKKDNVNDFRPEDHYNTEETVSFSFGGVPAVNPPSSSNRIPENERELLIEIPPFKEEVPEEAPLLVAGARGNTEDEEPVAPPADIDNSHDSLRRADIDLTDTTVKFEEFVPRIRHVVSEADADSVQPKDEVFMNRPGASEPGPVVVPRRTVDYQPGRLVPNQRGQWVNMVGSGRDHKKSTSLNDHIKKVDGTWSNPAPAPDTMAEIPKEKTEEKPAEEPGRLQKVVNWFKNTKFVPW